MVSGGLVPADAGYGAAMPGRVMVFAPSPQLSVTVEDRGGVPDLHIHPGGQGIWQARMIASLGVPVVICAALGGETGHVLRHLIPRERIELRAGHVLSRSGGYVRDGRATGRPPLVEAPPDALSRHELDELYEISLVEGLRAGVAVLSGAADDSVIPVDTYRQLAADLTRNGCKVLVDLVGPRLEASLEGGVYLAKLSHEELLGAELTDSEQVDDLAEAMVAIQARGASSVLVSRAHEPALARLDDEFYEIRPPEIHAAYPAGAGDSMTAAVAAGIADGEPLLEALRTGAAAGAINITRRGLGTGGDDGVRLLRDRVEVRRAKELRDR